MSQGAGDGIQEFERLKGVAVMAEKWELLNIFRKNGSISIYSPMSWEKIKIKDLFKRKNLSLRDSDDAIAIILDDGWEPFATRYNDDGEIEICSFRRIVNKVDTGEDTFERQH